MDFFNHQQQARQRTQLLVALFVLAVIALVVILNLLIAFVLIGLGEQEQLFTAVSAKQWFTITLVVIFGVGSASLFRWAQLLGGGKVVAESMGGIKLSPDSQDFYEKRLLNVVEEIALAAGMPVPPVYLIHSPSINAFAAGYRPSDAVIGVTEGTMKKLSREQLQGVIAHEFSHILNGDMRLNIRIMALLFGILFIGLLGRFLLDLTAHQRRRSSKDNSAGALLLLALGLIVVGYCGVFFGKLIKAAVSRQREFLADASAVQFTRNPEGISGALKVIAVEGSRLQGSAFTEASHLFFNQVERRSWVDRFSALFATHPDLDQRIRRIQPNWDGQYLAAQSAVQAQREAASAATTHTTKMGLEGLASAALVGAGIASVPVKEEAPVLQLADLARDPGLAPLLIYALLLEPQDSAYYQAQRSIIEASALVTNPKQVEFYAALVRRLERAEHLPLVDLAMPALKQMGAQSYSLWRQDLLALMQVNPHLDVFEWCLYRLVNLYLQAHFVPQPAVNRKLLNEATVLPAAAVVLSAVAYYGVEAESQAAQAFNAGAQVAGFTLQLADRRPSIRQLNEALNVLRRAYPHVQGRVLKALQAIVVADGQLLAVELNLLRTIAAVLDLPLADDDIRALVS